MREVPEPGASVEEGGVGPAGRGLHDGLLDPGSHRPPPESLFADFGVAPATRHEAGGLPEAVAAGPAARAPFDFQRFLAGLRARRDYAGQIAHVHNLPGRAAQWAEPAGPLPRPLAEALRSLGIGRLYRHQARALDLAREGRSYVVVSGTASGKTLCYNLPVAERLLAESGAHAFYLFPTKALAQDQLKSLRRLAEGSPELSERIRAGTYDGDTSPHTRRKLRDTANVVLTNPDMLHQGILPYHARWARFFSALRFVVVDEIHTYRGIFGSHVAHVLRRLRRIARHYGSDPVFIASSATIRNPSALAAGLFGKPVELVEEDGSPRGPRHFVFWNPPFLDPARMERRSTNVEGQELFTSLVREGVQTIVFTRARVTAELVYRYAREALARDRRDLAEAVSPYRGGYLPEERRDIERRLFSGQLKGVISTNALELGIDVGGLDAAILIGFPTTIASTWQQAGRAGRGLHPSLAVLVAYNDPIDQYLMRHPEYFFAASPEAAVVDPENPHILAAHLACAAFELPVRPEDREWFGELAPEVSAILEEEGQLKSLDGAYYWSSTEFPAAHTPLRTISDDTFTIVDAARENAVLATVDAISAPELVYPEAVYLHEGDTYFVRELDLAQKVAYVERRTVDYYTQAVLDSSLRVTQEGGEREFLPGESARLGQATVSWATVGFKKIRFHSLDSIGYRALDLPRLKLDTQAMWFRPSQRAWLEVVRQGRNPVEGLVGLRNLLITIVPLLAMCDRSDLGGIVDSSNFGAPTLFLYDRYPGGLGFAEQGFERFQEALEAARALLEECPCAAGCPSCVGLPILRPPQQQDPDVMHGWPIPDKETTRALLRSLLGGF
ncbi:MAG TPA: DEAD/DEAH box helicase [Candidatus Saccharimonadales bacterium]|nr:DEAD/DEAH box helicase [Candidatus Saccharimonadales bacterium]